MTTLDTARPPEGLRIYAIGDVHGCLDKLTAVHCWIEEDCRRHDPDDWVVVHLGDYIDRGPESLGVLRYLARYTAGPRVRALRGNHDQYLIDALADPDSGSFYSWMRYGGRETLESFGLRDEPLDALARADAMEAISERMTGAERRFLTGLPHMLRLGDFTFVHAGVRPGVPLEAQDETDMLWIRDEFLGSREDLGAVVVHGHTVVERPEMRPNRIGIDTGAVFGGPLSCLVLEGEGRWILGAGGRVPLKDAVSARVTRVH